MSTQENGGPESPSASNSKDAIFEPKPKPKMIRVLTVLAYVLSVSMAAILLSIYYIFMWDGNPHLGARRSHGVEAEELDASNHTDRNMISTSHSDYLYNTTVLVDVPRIRNLTRNNYEYEFNKTITDEATTKQYDEEFSVALKLLGKAFLLLKQKMSYKSTNGIKLTKCDSQQWKTNSIHEASVKFAGEEAKDRLYEPKHKKKLVRVLTVVAYVFFVSLAAIMLSLYYVFLWNGDQKIAAKYVTSQPKHQRQYISNKCILAAISDVEEVPVPSTVPTTTEEVHRTLPDDYDEFPIASSGTFIRKMFGRYQYEDS